MDKAESEALFNYIAKKEYPADYSKDVKCRLREKSASFCVSGGVLVHVGTRDNRTIEAFIHLIGNFALPSSLIRPIRVMRFVNKKLARHKTYNQAQ